MGAASQQVSVSPVPVFMLFPERKSVVGGYVQASLVFRRLSLAGADVLDKFIEVSDFPLEVTIVAHSYSQNMSTYYPILSQSEDNSQQSEIIPCRRQDNLCKPTLNRPNLGQ